MNSNILRIILTVFVAFCFAKILLGSYILAVGIFFLIFVLYLSVRSPLLFLISLIIIQERLFQTHNFGIPVWWYSDIAIVFLGLGIGLQFLKGRWPLGVGKNYYFRAILVLFGIVAFSMIWGAWLVYQQPVTTLMLRSRVFFLYMIFLYLFQVRFDIKQINAFMKFLTFSSVLVSILVIIDAKLLGGNKIFQLAWTNGISGFRAGGVRIFVYDFILLWAYFHLLSAIRFEVNRSRKFLCFLFLLIILYQFIFCNMTRQLLLMIFLTTFIFLCRLENRSKLFSIAVFLLVLMGASLISLGTNVKFESSLMGKLFSETQNEMSSNDHGNIAIRRNGIKFFYPYFKKTGFLGMGMMSTTYPGNPVYLGDLKRYYLADIGIFAILYRFGILAIVFLVIVLFKLFKDLLFIQNRTVDSSLRIYSNGLVYLLIANIIFMPSLSIIFQDTTSIYFGIIFYFVYKMKDSLETAHDFNYLPRP